MPRRTALLLLTALALSAGVACAPTRSAPPRLIASWPSTSGRLPLLPLTVELTFNRALSADSSWAAVWGEEDGTQLPGESGLAPGRSRVLTLRLERPEAGEFRLHWHAVSARNGAVADGEQLFGFQGESPRPARLDVSQSSAESGDKLEIKGRGFARSSAVRLTIGDDQQDLKTIQTDARGGFQEEARVPSAVSFGMQPITAVDADGTSASAAVQVRWGGWPPLMAFAVGQPGQTPGEVNFSVSVRNRSDYLLEKVRVVLEDPDGATFVAAQPAGIRAAGSVAWEIGAMDRGVGGPFRASYRARGGVAAHARIEFRHRKPPGCSGDECLPAFVSETTSDSTVVYPAD